jgi:hypothetical protein
MSLKQLNSASANRPLPKDWTPDKRFIRYAYAPFKFPTHTLPQGHSGTPSTSDGSGLKSLESRSTAGKGKVASR